MRSFHGCLGPLVYESYATQNDDSDSVNSNSSTESTRFKMTTFETVPPIMIVTLEDRSEGASESKTATRGEQKSEFKVEKTIYMDRYLLENKDKALQGYQEIEGWRSKAKQARKEMLRIKHYNVTLL